ncbi:MAG: energy transducer TonB [Alphaproteobacteria bacterium]|nr:energy transducer TonB [Alphaproteobacteria bacterium]
MRLPAEAASRVAGGGREAADDARANDDRSAAPGAMPPGLAQAEPGNPLPDYPQLSRLRGQEGRVRLAVRIDAEGRVTELRIVESSGHALLDKAAREAVERWRFRPATRDGRPVADEVVVPVEFRFTQ